MKKIILELEDDEYDVIKGVFPKLPTTESLTLGRTVVKVRITESKNQAKEVKEETESETESETDELPSSDLSASTGNEPEIPEIPKTEEEEEKDEQNDNPLDVNKDGIIDIKDVVAVAKGAVKKVLGKDKKKK